MKRFVFFRGKRTWKTSASVHFAFHLLFPFSLQLSLVSNEDRAALGDIFKVTELHKISLHELETFGRTRHPKERLNLPGGLGAVKVEGAHDQSNQNPAR